VFNPKSQTLPVFFVLAGLRGNDGDVVGFNIPR